MATPSDDERSLRQAQRVARRVPGGEAVSASVVRLPLPTPTLPPATTTNHYLVGDRAAVLVDPATPDRAAQRSLIEAVERWSATVAPVQALVLSHHHHDHIGAASALRDALGLPIHAHALTAERLSGRLSIDALIAEGDVVAEDHAGPWRAIHTPGHAPGHIVLCGPRGEQVVGDMVAGEGTILVDPRDGDMAAYLASLERMRALTPLWLAPAHGPVLTDADSTLTHYLAHRRAREEKVYAALAPEPQTAESLLPRAYADTPRRAWPFALRAMKAHLIHLEQQGRAVHDAAGGWRQSDVAGPI